MSAQRRSVARPPASGRGRGAGAFVLLMVFTGTVLGHYTLNSATFDCDGTVTYHINDWTTRTPAIKP